MKRNPIWNERQATRIARLGTTEAAAWTKKLKDVPQDEREAPKAKGRDDE